MLTLSLFIMEATVIFFLPFETLIIKMEVLCTNNGPTYPRDVRSDQISTHER